ncbi:MAG: HlyC/CorC family transporter [Alphaproteobacteria bacterium]|nr:HlyC/CorC family transporter [Alphaproteobacteria bacterium]
MRTESEAFSTSSSPAEDGEQDEPSRIQKQTENSSKTVNGNGNGNGHEKPGLLSRLKYLFTGQHEKNDNGLREAIEEYIVEPLEELHTDPVSSHERLLLSNILKLQDLNVVNVMVPRADIVALDVNSSKDELFALLAEKQCSRFPVYKDTLDEVLGTVHIKDIVEQIANKQKVNLLDVMAEVPIVSPSMPVLDLVLKMRSSRRHMALVVDEYGGIDGLVTIGDIIEAIIGEVDDEHDIQNEPTMKENRDGSIVADARVNLQEFEDRFGTILSEEEREESDTLGGLVFDIAGRVPARGEVITHDTGMVFEVLEGDPRRIDRVKITHIPEPEDMQDEKTASQRESA